VYFPPPRTTGHQYSEAKTAASDPRLAATSPAQSSGYLGPSGGTQPSSPLLLLPLSSQLLPPAHGPCTASLCCHEAPSPRCPRRLAPVLARQMLWFCRGIIPAHLDMWVHCRRGKKPIAHRGALGTCPAGGTKAVSAPPQGHCCPRAVPGLPQGSGTTCRQLRTCAHDAAHSSCASVPSIRCSGWTGRRADRYSIPKPPSPTGSKGSGTTCALAKAERQKSPRRAHFSHHVEKWERRDRVKHWLVYPRPPMCPVLPALGWRCPAGSAPLGPTWHPGALGHPPAPRLPPTNGEPRASLRHEQSHWGQLQHLGFHQQLAQHGWSHFCTAQAVTMGWAGNRAGY